MRLYKYKFALNHSPSTDLQPFASSWLVTGNSRVRENGQIMLGSSAPKQPGNLLIQP